MILGCEYIDCCSSFRCLLSTLAQRNSFLVEQTLSMKLSSVVAKAVEKSTQNLLASHTSFSCQ